MRALGSPQLLAPAMAAACIASTTQAANQQQTCPQPGEGVSSSAGLTCQQLCGTLRPHFDPRRLDVGDVRVQRQPGNRMHQEALVQRGTTACTPCGVHGKQVLNMKVCCIQDRHGWLLTGRRMSRHRSTPNTEPAASSGPPVDQPAHCHCRGWDCTHLSGRAGPPCAQRAAAQTRRCRRCASEGENTGKQVAKWEEATTQACCRSISDLAGKDEPRVKSALQKRWHHGTAPQPASKYAYTHLQIPQRRQVAGPVPRCIAVPKHDGGGGAQANCRGQGVGGERA